MDAISAQKQTYSIIRFYFGAYDPEILDTGLTLRQAQLHCQNPETSSSTANSPEAHELTQEKGDWFDGYEED